MEIRVDGQRVRSLREANLWTQEELADRCRVHARTVQRVEAAGTGSAPTIRAIAEALGVDPMTLERATANGDPPRTASALAFPWTGVAASFLWVALSCLVYVPTADVGRLTALVAALGFVSFCLGLWCWTRRTQPA